MTNTPKYRNVRFPQSSVNLSKAEEIDIVNHLAEVVPAGSFLSSFFSADMVTHLTYQIKNDLSCDVYDDLEATRHLANVRHDQLANLQADERLLEQARHTAGYYKQLSEDSSNVIAQLRIERSDALDQADRNEKKLAAALNQISTLDQALLDAQAKLVLVNEAAEEIYSKAAAAYTMTSEMPDKAEYLQGFEAGALMASRAIEVAMRTQANPPLAEMSLDEAIQYLAATPDDDDQE